MPPDLDPSQWGLGALLTLFVAASLVLTIAGVQLTRDAATLAERTGLGQATFGAAFVGGATSLSGIVVSVSAAANGHAELAASNALGGITAQTTFLAIADLAHRESNLEHAAASAASLLQAALLMTLLALPLIALAAPEVAWLGVHPISLLLFGGYLFGLRLAAQIEHQPAWRPLPYPKLPGSKPEEAQASPTRSLPVLWARFALFAVVLGACGYVVGQAGVGLAEQSGLSQTAVGSLLTAVSTSLPELVTAVAAVRQGALALAVGDILGGNTFDTLLLAFSDFAYREGSLYAALGDQHFVVIGVAQVLTGLVLLGLVRRERHGLGNIGFESVACLVVYALAAVFVLT